MKNYTQAIDPSLLRPEAESENLLMRKMGMSQREIREVYAKYGVSASRLVEVMQLSKYPFVYEGRVAGQCEPCMLTRRLVASSC